MRNAFLGSSGKKVWSAALLTKLSADIGISAFAFPRLADLLNKGEFGLLAIGGSMFLVSVLAHTTWFSLMLVNSLSALFIRHKAEQAAELSAEELPNVTVQIPCRNEPFEIMKNNSIQSALALDYPREKLTIQVIDNSEEGRYTELQEYCAANGIEFL
ncbi:MAG: hypothetical protein LBD99_00660, partial [Candidatus Margulisbacteria bacterium]|nr:hypothetical protein [Candidatus Margulisiibacteriota bacterium]